MYEVNLVLYQNGWGLKIESQEKETIKEQYYSRKEIVCKNLKEALKRIESDYKSG